jgi:hypothetical protein
MCWEWKKCSFVTIGSLLGIQYVLLVLFGFFLGGLDAKLNAWFSEGLFVYY